MISHSTFDTENDKENGQFLRIQLYNDKLHRVVKSFCHIKRFEQFTELYVCISRVLQAGYLVLCCV